MGRLKGESGSADLTVCEQPQPSWAWHMLENIASLFITREVSERRQCFETRHKLVSIRVKRPGDVYSWTDRINLFYSASNRLCAKQNVEDQLIKAFSCFPKFIADDMIPELI